MQNPGAQSRPICVDLCFISDSKLSRLMSDYEVTLVNDNSESDLYHSSYLCFRCFNHVTVYAIKFVTIWYP